VEKVHLYSERCQICEPDERLGLPNYARRRGARSVYRFRDDAKKKPIQNEGNASVVKTAYPTDDIAIVNYNVMDYGAMGDGTTDDASAFQNALNTAAGKGGGIVFIPAGQYKIADTLVVPTYVTLRGDWANPEKAGGQRVHPASLCVQRGYCRLARIPLP
jgi:hypothetical protein